MYIQDISMHLVKYILGGSVTRWDVLKLKILIQFNPMARTAKLKAKINIFRQLDDETFR